MTDRFRNLRCVHLLSSGGTGPDNELESSSSRVRLWIVAMDGEILPERFRFDNEIPVTMPESLLHWMPKNRHGEVVFVHDWRWFRGSLRLALN